MSVFGVILVHIFPHLDWIRTDTENLSVFSQNAWKHGLEKLRIRTLFTQCKFCKDTDYCTISCSIQNLFTAQKLKVSNKHFFSKCDQIRSFLWVWSHLLKKSLMDNFIFCSVIQNLLGMSFRFPIFDELYIYYPYHNFLVMP